MRKKNRVKPNAWGIQDLTAKKIKFSNYLYLKIYGVRVTEGTQIRLTGKL